MTGATKDDGGRDPSERILDAAEALWYERGVQAVGMDAIRDSSGVSLRRIYQIFPSKESLLVAVLERRDVRWRARLADYVSQKETPEEKLVGIFEWLQRWFEEPGFRGCAWVNMNGELGAVVPAVAAETRRHKAAFRSFVSGLVRDAGMSADLADALVLLAEGAMVTAGIFASAAPAVHAATAARELIGSARAEQRRAGRRAAFPWRADGAG